MANFTLIDVDDFLCYFEKFIGKRPITISSIFLSECLILNIKAAKTYIKCASYSSLPIKY